MKGFTAAATAAVLLASSVQAAVDPIVIKGSKFFYKTNGTQFYMNGVAYQQGINGNTTQTDAVDYIDPIADTTACKRDIEFLAKLKTNTIRVYAIDPAKNHDECMTALADAGIYVIADLSQPGESIIRDEPAWTTDLFDRYTKVIDVMAKYDNTLGFFAGNEVSNQPNNTHASAFVKAAVRDSKAYIKRKNYRPIGVGYATNDDAEIRENLASFFNCGNAEDSIDFWGYNIYSWCGESSFEKSGFDVRTKEFEKYNVPVFFAEYGCNAERPREFTEVGALYGKQMTGVWSGGIVYMYFEETNQFGLASIKNGKVETNEDFDNLSKEIAKVTPSAVKMADYNPSNTAASACPQTNSNWAAVATPLPPAANAELCSCMVDTLSCTVADKVDKEQYGKLFGTVCGYEDGKFCEGINKNTTKAGYGAYGMCAPNEQLGFALNAYAAQNTQSGCDFKGSATAKQAAQTTAAQCGALMAEAGKEGTGTVTSAPTGTARPAGGASGTKGAASGLTIPRFEMGLVGLAFYVFGAVATGMAIILL
ncbi:Glucanosyltransferase-domain-containing protein [Massariosphaeria phaeospora]|uniref:1,3-beta-glucanosyltransferase n=1 Tax=Massariosphaeria phaeospora TaxID=100035 RepID=A0A7C8I4Z1_9PLEO|nr:Glucanosyltransferase-domain-containing protein [Massariosphaeria phaeospora]